MTDTEKYHVILTSHIRSGYEPELVIKSFAAMFGITIDKARNVVRTRRILKKDVSRAKAEKYRQRLNSIGLDVILERVGEAPAKVERPRGISPKKTTLELVPLEEQRNNESADSSIRSTENIVCPKCQLQQQKTDQCSGCGVFFHKIKQTELGVNMVVPAPPIAAPQAETSQQSEHSIEQSSPVLQMFLVPVAVAILGALLWKFVAVTFNYEFSLIAWLIGGAIGISAAMTGAKGQNAAIFCAVLALLAIMGGKYLAISSFVSDAMAAASGTAELEGVDLKSVYDEMQIDAAKFSNTVKDEQSLREFMVERGYSESTNAASVTDDEIKSFRENKQPDLEEMVANPQSFDDWKNDTLTQELQNLSTVDLMLGSLGLLDFLFLFFGVGTAYRLGMGTQ